MFLSPAHATGRFKPRITGVAINDDGVSDGT
jgi:hypothetical protein